MQTGTEGAPCFANDTCNPGLTCLSKVCVKLPDSGAMDSGSETGTLTCPKSVSCTSYCTFLNMACTGGNAQIADPTCTALCNALGAQNLGTLNDTASDTIGCRIYHSCAASMSATNAAVHCPHAGIWSAGDTCGTQCDAFCQINFAVCTGQNAAFTGMNECLSKCGMWAPGTSGATSGNSRACREHYLELATTNAATNCPNTKDVSAACQ